VNFRLEQTLRDGYWTILFSAAILPMWLLTASAHGDQWKPLWQSTGWDGFVLSWGGLVWGGMAAVLLGLWTNYSFIESKGYVSRLWNRLTTGLLLFIFVVTVSVPGWSWLADLAGASTETVLFYATKSCLIPIGALTFSALARLFIPNSISFLLSLVATLLLTEFVWPELV